MNEFDYLAKANQYELNSRTEWLCDLKNDVAQYNKLIAVQRTILHEIQESVPDFDIEVYNKYKNMEKFNLEFANMKLNLIL